MTRSPHRSTHSSGSLRGQSLQYGDRQQHPRRCDGKCVVRRAGRTTLNPLNRHRERVGFGAAQAKCQWIAMDTVGEDVSFAIAKQERHSPRLHSAGR